jgi:hypothetical protein
MFEKDKFTKRGGNEIHDLKILLSKRLDESTVQVQTSDSNNREHENDNSKENLKRVADNLSKSLPKLFVQVQISLTITFKLYKLILLLPCSQWITPFTHPT